MPATGGFVREVHCTCGAWLDLYDDGRLYDPDDDSEPTVHCPQCDGWLEAPALSECVHGVDWCAGHECAGCKVLDARDRLEAAGFDFPQSAERGCDASGKEPARDRLGQPAQQGFPSSEDQHG